MSAPEAEDAHISMRTPEAEVTETAGIREVTSLAEWEALCEEVGDKPIVVDFFASWCGPCKIMAPVFKEMYEKHAESVVFVKVDVDVASDVARKYSVTAMPTFYVFKGGNHVDKLVGANRRELAAMIEKAAGDGQKKASRAKFSLSWLFGRKREKKGEEPRSQAEARG